MSEREPWPLLEVPLRHLQSIGSDQLRRSYPHSRGRVRASGGTLHLGPPPRRGNVTTRRQRRIIPSQDCCRGLGGSSPPYYSSDNNIETIATILSHSSANSCLHLLAHYEHCSEAPRRFMPGIRRCARDDDTLGLSHIFITQRDSPCALKLPDARVAWHIQRRPRNPPLQCGARQCRRTSTDGRARSWSRLVAPCGVRSPQPRICVGRVLPWTRGTVQKSPNSTCGLVCQVACVTKKMTAGGASSAFACCRKRCGGCPWTPPSGWACPLTGPPAERVAKARVHA